jgi:hypothetical protein
MTTPSNTEREIDWSQTMPKTIGLWEIRCAETDMQATRVAITNRGARLYVHDDAVGVNPVKHFHDGLIDLWWRKLS